MHQNGPGPEMEQLKGGQQYQIVLLSVHNNWLKVKTLSASPFKLSLSVILLVSWCTAEITDKLKLH